MSLNTFVVCLAVAALAVVGCGSDLASPNHVGSWEGQTSSLFVWVDVSGSAGDYSAKCWYVGIGDDPRDETVQFTGGKVDSLGNMTFPDEGDQTLTLGPVEGGLMTATVLDGDTTVSLSK